MNDWDINSSVIRYGLARSLIVEQGPMPKPILCELVDTEYQTTDAQLSSSITVCRRHHRQEEIDFTVASIRPAGMVTVVDPLIIARDHRLINENLIHGRMRQLAIMRNMADMDDLYVRCMRLINTPQIRQHEKVNMMINAALIALESSIA